LEIIWSEIVLVWNHIVGPKWFCCARFDDKMAVKWIEFF
jgi:hypothetical protein